MFVFRVMHLPADGKQQNECMQKRIRSAWASNQSDQSSQCTQWVTKDPTFMHAENDQNELMPKLTVVFL